MKVKLEAIQPDSDRSFRILLTPRLNEYFYWHFHPEYEIVYVEGANGTRHIGDHISRYEGSDLVFIGPHIPHLNFDYGVKTDCEQVVVQMRADFLGKDFLQIPEMKAVWDLFEKSRQGISFTGKTKSVVGERLKKLPSLSPFDQLMELLQIFRLLASSGESNLLGVKPLSHAGAFREQERMERIHRFLEDNFNRKIDAKEVAAFSNLSQAAFCRYFKKVTRLTFTDFLNKYRVNQARNFLLQHKTVTEACYDCGFESLSHFSKTFKKITGESPASFKKNWSPGR